MPKEKIKNLDIPDNVYYEQIKLSNEEKLDIIKYTNERVESNILKLGYNYIMHQLLNGNKDRSYVEGFLDGLKYKKITSNKILREKKVK